MRKMIMKKDWKQLWIPLILAFALVGCNLAGSAGQSQATAMPSQNNPAVTYAPTETLTEAATATLSPSLTATTISTATPALPADAVIVNTFSQGIYPFPQTGTCTLGAAIQSVLSQQAVDQCTLPPGSTTIDLPTGIYMLTQPDDAPAILFGRLQKDREGMAPAGFPLIAGQLTILGNGSTIQRSGPTKFGIFEVFVGGDLTLKDLTLSGGDVSQEQDGSGGALNILGGSVTLSDVTLTGNQAVTGGAIQNDSSGTGTSASLSLIGTTVTKNVATQDGGGIYNLGSLTIQDSQISDNAAQDKVEGGGGIYNTAGQLILDHSLLDGNIAFEGGGLYNDGGSVNILDQSVLSGNVATSYHAFISHGGGGINNIGYQGSGDTPAHVTIQDSFIISNQAGGSTGGGIYNQARLTVTDSVLSSNVAGAGGAIFSDTQGIGSITGSCILQNQAVSVTPKDFGNGIDNENDQPFDARQDWWGSPGGPGNSITRNINAASPLNSAPDLCASSLPTPYPTPMNP
jgi:hypothetical protein